MKGRTILAACLRPFPQNVCLVLVVLLGVAAIGWGQEPPAEGRRRTPRAARLRTVQLPEPSRSSGVSVGQALVRLLNLPAPTDQRLRLEQIGQLLWAGQGVALARAGNAAAREPLPGIRIYVALPDGFYVYNPGMHTLQQTGEGDVRGPLAAAVTNQQAGPMGGCQFILAGASRDFSSRFGNKARNVMLLQAGQMAQSIQLEAVSQDLTFIAVGNIGVNTVRRTCRLPRELEPLYVLLMGSTQAQTTEAAQPQPTQGPAKRVVFIVPQTGFQDEELFATRRGLELASVQTVIASTKIGAITGSLGGVAEAQLLVNRVVVEDFDAVVFIGGPGTAGLLGNRMVLDLARRAAVTNRVIAASGNAPSILADAGVISGARVTGLLAARDRLVLAGAIYTGTPVEKDGPLVTSAGPLVVPQFVMAIRDALAGR